MAAGRKWKEEVSSLGIAPGSIVHTIQVQHPELADRQQRGELRDCAEWWPRARVSELQRRVASWCAQNPNADSIPNELMLANYDDGKGPRFTADLLAAAGVDVSRLGAVLIGASIFARAKSSRRHYPREDWPNIAVAVTLLEWMNRTHESTWSPAFTNTLPMHNDDFGCELRTVGKLVEALAVEHAKVLHAFVPVRVQFASTTVPGPRLRLT